MRHKPLWTLIAFPILTLAGCLPGGTWLPDSSGFVFTAGRNYEQLMLFDAKTGKTSVLVKNMGGSTFWPAVCPDGKQIAVAHQKPKGKGEGTLQLVFYDRGGKELKRTEEFPWHPVDAKKPYMHPLVFWSPTGDKILISASLDGSGLYDTKKEKLRRFEGMPIIIGNSPFRPDGKGFLAFVFEKDKEVILWMDSNLRRTALRKSTKELVESDLIRWVINAPFLCDSWWEGSDAYSRYDIWQVRFNLQLNDLSTIKTEPERGADLKRVHRRFQFPKTKTQVRLVTTEEYASAGVIDPVRVETQLPNAKKPTIVVQEAGFAILLPSPDQTLVALRCFSRSLEDPATERLLIIDQNGRVLLDQQIAEKEKVKAPG